MDDELLLLGLLSGSAMHGYHVNEVIERRLPMISSIKPSTAYSVLDRLATRGFVTAAFERLGRRPERKVYSLTEAGRERFLSLLRENLRSADLPTHPGDQGLLFLHALPNEEVLALLAERRAATESLRPALERLRDNHAPGSTGRLVAEHRIAHLEAELAWLESVIAGALSRA